MSRSLRSPSPDSQGRIRMPPTAMPGVQGRQKIILSDENEFITPLKQTTGIDQVSTEALNDREAFYRRTMREKEELIGELKNLIKMISAGRQSPEDQLKAKIKVLTLENNRLMDLIQRIEGRETSVSGEEHTQRLEKQNSQLARMLRESEDHVKGLRAQSDKAPIARIKEQYAESLRQFKQSICEEVETIFGAVRIGLQKLNKKVQMMETRLRETEKKVVEHTKRKQSPSFGGQPSEGQSWGGSQSWSVTGEDKVDESRVQSDVWKIEDVQGKQGSKQMVKKHQILQQEEGIKVKNTKKPQIMIEESVSSSQRSSEGEERLLSEEEETRLSFKRTISQNGEKVLLKEVAELRRQLECLESIYRQEQKEREIQKERGDAVAKDLAQVQRNLSQQLAQAQEARFKSERAVQQLQSLLETEKEEGRCKIVHITNNVCLLREQMNRVQSIERERERRASLLDLENEQLLKANRELSENLKSKQEAMEFLQKEVLRMSFQLRERESQLQNALQRESAATEELKRRELTSMTTQQKLIEERASWQKQALSYLSLFNVFHTIEASQKPVTSDLSSLNSILTKLQRLTE